jgi:hypothetical protein
MDSHKNKRPKTRATKRPPSAFLLFCRDERQTICERCPHMSPSDVSSLLSHLWRLLGEESKAQYKEEELRLQGEYRHAFQESVAHPIAAPSLFAALDFRPFPMPLPALAPPPHPMPPAIVRHSPPARGVMRRFEARPATPKFPSVLEMSFPIHGIAADHGGFPPPVVTFRERFP